MLSGKNKERFEEWLKKPPYCKNPQAVKQLDKLINEL